MRHKKIDSSSIRIFSGNKLEVLISELTTDGTLIVECETCSGTVDVRIIWNVSRKQWEVTHLKRSTESKPSLGRNEKVAPLNPSKRRKG